MPGDLTRRDLLVATGMGLVGLAAAACSSSSPPASDSTDGSTPGTSTGTAPPTPGSTPGTGPVKAATLDEPTMAKLDQLLGQGVRASGVPGVEIGVWIGSQEWRRTAGVIDLASGLPFRAGTKARIASITKTFTGTIVLQLVDQGVLTLDDKLERYIPGIANGNQITIRNLLGMTSGIFDFTADEQFLAKFNSDPTMAWSDEETLAIIKAHPAAFAPGAQVVYCDSNYVLLGMIAAQISGLTLDQLVQARILDRLALAGTSYPTTATMPEPHPTAYFPTIPAGAASPYPFDNVARPPRVTNEVNPAVAAGAGAMTSTVLDLKTWAKELTDGSLLTPASQRARLDTKPMKDQKIVRYGLGVMAIGQFIGHSGAIIGYNSVVLRLPGQDATFVAVANESTNATTPTLDLIMLPIMQELYPNALA